MVRRVHHFDKSSHFYKRYTKLAMNGIDMFDRMGLNSRKETMYTYYFKNDINIQPYLIYADEMWEEKNIEELTEKEVMNLSKYEWHDMVSILRKSDEELMANLEV